MIATKNAASTDTASNNGTACPLKKYFQHVIQHYESTTV